MSEHNAEGVELRFLQKPFSLIDAFPWRVSAGVGGSDHDASRNTGIEFDANLAKVGVGGGAGGGEGEWGWEGWWWGVEMQDATRHTHCTSAPSFLSTAPPPPAAFLAQMLQMQLEVMLEALHGILPQLRLRLHFWGASRTLLKGL